MNIYHPPRRPRPGAGYPNTALVLIALGSQLAPQQHPHSERAASFPRRWPALVLSNSASCATPCRILRSALPRTKGIGQPAYWDDAAAATETLVPGFHSLQAPCSETAAALQEAEAALAKHTGDGPLELGRGLAATRELRGLRRKYYPARHRAAQLSWAMRRGKRFNEALPLATLPHCASLLLWASSASGFLHRPVNGTGLNVIIRRYEPGDWLGRHTDDVDLFDEPVLAVVLKAGSPSDGLKLSLPWTTAGLSAARADALAAGAVGPLLPPLPVSGMPASTAAPKGAPDVGATADLTALGHHAPEAVRHHAPEASVFDPDLVQQKFRVEETSGLTVCLEREARYLFTHEVPPVEQSRVSMTWRWFRADCLAELEDTEAWLDGDRMPSD